MDEDIFLTENFVAIDRVVVGTGWYQIIIAYKKEEEAKRKTTEQGSTAAQF